MTNNVNASCPASLDFDIKLLGEDKSVNLCEEYLGKVILVVNTASKCGFTPQYDGLQSLQEKYDSEQFSVLAFPCNQFGGQEPGTDNEIQELDCFR